MQGQLVGTTGFSRGKVYNKKENPVVLTSCPWVSEDAFNVAMVMAMMSQSALKYCPTKEALRYS